MWIVECGSIDEWPGGFDAFRAAIAAAEIEVTESEVGDGETAFDVRYVSPTVGTLELGWEGPLRVNGADHALADYPRMDNPFAQVPFPASDDLVADERYEISDGAFGLVLDFGTDERSVSVPPDGRARAQAQLDAIWEAVRTAVEGS